MKMTTILQFTDGLSVGGKERQLIELLKGFNNQNRYKFDLAVMSPDIGYPQVERLNINFHYLIRTKKKDATILVDLYKLCRKIKPDIIHVWDSMTAVYTVPIAKLLGIKIVNGMIRGMPECFRPFNQEWLRAKLTFPFSDVIVSNSFAALEAFKVSSDKGTCIHNGFDLGRANVLKDPEDIRKELRLGEDKIVGIVASFTEIKDHKSFINSAVLILKKLPNVTFLLLGDGPTIEKCKKMVGDNLKNKFRFLGVQKDVESIVNIFDVGVLTSLGEGFPNAVMEYMALGKPVVATDCGGTRELVIHGKTGYIVQVGSPVEISNAILMLLENTERSKSMGVFGRTRINNNFNLKRMTECYRILYDSLMMNNTLKIKTLTNIQQLNKEINCKLK